MGTQWCLGVVVPIRGASPKMSNSLNGLKQTGKLRSMVCCTGLALCSTGRLHPWGS